MLYSIGPINVCTDFEINRYKIDEVRKYAKIVFYLIYLMGTTALLIGILTRNIFETNQKSLQLLVQKLWLK